MKKVNRKRAQAANDGEWFPPTGPNEPHTPLIERLEEIDPPIGGRDGFMRWQLRQLREATEEDERRDIAAYLLTSIGNDLRAGRPVAEPLRVWLADALTAAAAGTGADIALSLKNPPHRPRLRVTQAMTQAAAVYAVMTWCRVSRSTAADRLSDTLAKEAGTLSDAVTTVQRTCHLDGPYVVRRPGKNGDPFEVLRDRLATIEDLEQGRQVSVDMISREAPRVITGVPVKPPIAKVVRALQIHRK